MNISKYKKEWSMNEAEGQLKDNTNAAKGGVMKTSPCRGCDNEFEDKNCDTCFRCTAREVYATEVDYDCGIRNIPKYSWSKPEPVDEEEEYNLSPRTASVRIRTRKYSFAEILKNNYSEKERLNKLSLLCY